MAKKRSKSDRMDRLAALREKLENTDVGGSQQGWFSPKEGRNIIRIMPEVGDMDEYVFFQEVGKHYIPGANNKSLYCPEFTTGGDEECPICEMVNQLYRGSEEDKKLASSLRVRKQYWMNVIDRDNESAGPQIFTPGQTIMRALIAYINDPEYGDMSDVDEGYDITIERKGSGMDTEYNVLPRRNISPLHKDEATIDEWLKAAKDLSVVVLSDNPDEDKELSAGHAVYVLPYERLQEEFSKLLGADDVEEYEDDTEEEEEQHEVQKQMAERRARRTRRS